MAIKYNIKTGAAFSHLYQNMNMGISHLKNICHNNIKKKIEKKDLGIVPICNLLSVTTSLT